MNTTFTKQIMQHALINGSMAVWKRCLYPMGVVGTKF
jgi:hypothetical protein